MPSRPAPIGEATRTPAPGAYSYDNEQSSSFRFGNLAREVDFKIKKTPGPNSYDIKGLMGSGGPKSSMHKNLTNQTVDTENKSKPGPG